MDNFEKNLELLFNESIELPTEYQYMIRNTIKNRKRVKINIKPFKILVGVCGCIVAMTTVVFAKDIVQIFSEFFTNSTKAIDEAIENGYVQTVVDDFVYSNGIGIKVEHIIIDDSVLDISYLYSYNGKINSIELDKYTIKDNNDNLFYQYDSENAMNEKPFVVKEIITGKDEYNSEKADEGIFRSSILYKSNNFPKSEKLLITINRIKINNTDIIEGNWNLQVDLDSKFNLREKKKYKIINSEHILKSEITLSETTLKVYLQIDEEHGEHKFLFENPANLKDADNQFNLFPSETWNNVDDPNLKNKSECQLEFDLSKYNDNIKRLYLEIPVNENLILNLKLEQE